MTRSVWINDKILPESEARISVYDSAFMFADVPFEMMRSFNGQPFKLREHMERLLRSCDALEVPIKYSVDDLMLAHFNVVLENRNSYDEEFRTMVNVSRGILPKYKFMGLDMNPWVMFTCFALKDIIGWDAHTIYEKGVRVVIPAQRTLSAKQIDPKIKHRSRIHFKMADREAQRTDPVAWSLLLDEDGFIAEGSGSNIFLVKNGELFTPEPRNILRGISRQMVMDLTRQIKREMFVRNLEPYDIYGADEAFFTNTPYSIVPIIRVNGHCIGNGKPGKMTKYLTYKWGESVKCDFVEQAKRWA